MMSKLSAFLILCGLLIAPPALAAIETRTYLLTFENLPNAGPAFNISFSFSLHPSLTPVNLKTNHVWENSVLTITGPNIIAAGESWQETITLSGPSEILDQIDNQEVLFDWQDANFQGVGKTTFKRVANPGVIENLRANTALVKQLKKIGVPLAVGLGGLGIISLGTSAVTASATLAFNIAEFFRYIAFGFLRFKKRKPWGTVYNQVTNRSIAGAVVKIFEARTKKIKETQLTDKEGRFGFLITPGEYYIKVARRGFQEKQTNVLKIAKPEAMVDFNIYLSATATVTKKFFGFIKFLNILKAVVDRLNPYVLALGTALSIFVAVVVPNTLNYIIVGIYVVLDILKILLTRQVVKSFGVVSDQNSRRPLDLSVVRIFDAEKNWLLNTKVTDAGGRFNFLTTAGFYYLTAMRSGYQPFHSQIMEVKKAGIINFDIKLSGE